MKQIKFLILSLCCVYACNAMSQETFWTKGASNDSLCFIIPKVGSKDKVAFAGCKNSIVLKIPNSVTHDGKTYEVVSIAFQALTGNRQIVEVNIPASVHVIEASAFEGCINLKKVNLENGIKIINDYAFQDCTNLKECVIPETVTTIGEAVFRGCDHLKAVTLPSKITEIPYKLFMGCFKLQSVNIPSGVTHIGDYAFCNCTALRQLSIPDNAQLEKHSLQGCGSAAMYAAKIKK